MSLTVALDITAAARWHAFFEWSGMAAGAWWWRRSMRRDGRPGPLQPGSFAVLVGLLAGAAIGNKAAFLAERPDVALAWWHGQFLPLGQSIVGGLMGGLLGVETAKVLTGQTRSTGDALVLPLCLGIAVGRIGCFAAGLHDATYGVTTTLPWGVDFGDGLARHPTQLYEIGFLALLAMVLHACRPRLDGVPGLRFKLFLAAYLAWRWAIDGLKPVPVAYALGWSGIQWLCALALAAYAPFVWRATQCVRPPLHPMEH